MHIKQARLRALIFLATIIFILAGTFVTIRYAQGYRPTKNGTIKGTGLLNANSFPTGAEVYINGRLTTATDTTLNLDPGEYQIELKKDGYHTWKKLIEIENELVVQTNAQLFPTSPTLAPLTYTGAINPIPSPDGNQVAFTVASASAVAKNGLYVQDLSSGTLNLGRSARQIARSTEEYDYTKSHYTYSPNGSEIIVSFDSGANLLLKTNDFNDIKDVKDVTVRLPSILKEWEEELARKTRTELVELPLQLQQIFLGATATDSAITSITPLIDNVYFSPDGEKLLYRAIEDIILTNGLIPEVLAKNNTEEQRELKSGNYYVYDLEEDTNYLVYENKIATGSATTKLLLLDSLSPITAELGSSPSAFKKLQSQEKVVDNFELFNAQYSPITHLSLQWYPDSAHLIVTRDNAIEIMEYDGQNKVTIYAGPFDPTFVYPWPDGSRLVTRIQFSPETTPNLYTIKLK